MRHAIQFVDESVKNISGDRVIMLQNMPGIWEI